MMGRAASKRHGKVLRCIFGENGNGELSFGAWRWVYKCGCAQGSEDIDGVNNHKPVEGESGIADGSLERMRDESETALVSVLKEEESGGCELPCIPGGRVSDHTYRWAWVGGEENKSG